MRCLAQTPGHNSTSRPKSVFASKIDTFEWGGGKERFQSLYGPTAEMFTQQGARCLSLLWIQKCPGHIAYEGDITLGHIDFKTRDFPLLKPLAKAAYGLTLVFDHMELSKFLFPVKYLEMAIALNRYRFVYGAGICPGFASVDENGSSRHYG